MVDSMQIALIALYLRITAPPTVNYICLKSIRLIMPRLNVYVSEAAKERLTAYQKKNRHSNQDDALSEILEALDVDGGA